MAVIEIDKSFAEAAKDNWSSIPISLQIPEEYMRQECEEKGFVRFSVDQPTEIKRDPYFDHESYNS